MSTALYRRYRPESFADVIGQEHVTEPLMQALRTGRIGHAYLFSGPRGCGKTTSARILARCLNCEQGPTPTPCGVCQSCVALARGGSGSMDVIEIDAASHGGVDDARDLREKASYGPAQSRYKVYIIDEAHMVTPQGFNALLKIVEEPPEHVKFVFATTEPEKVIGTIRSRTHHYPFRLVPPARLQDYLEELCEREGVAVERGVLSFVIRAGGGSVRDSLSVLDQLISGSGEDGLTYAGAAALLGFTEGELLDATVDAFAASDGAAVFRQVDRVIETGQDPRRFVEDLLERLRDLIVVAALNSAGGDGATAIFRGLPQDQLDRMQQQAAAFGPGELSYAADTVNTGLTEMTGATSPRLQLELICARLLLPRTAGEHGFAARIDRLEQRLEMAGPQPPARGRPGRAAEFDAASGRHLDHRTAPPGEAARAEREASPRDEAEPTRVSSMAAASGPGSPAHVGGAEASAPQTEQRREPSPAASTTDVGAVAALDTSGTGSGPVGGVDRRRPAAAPAGRREPDERTPTPVAAPQEAPARPAGPPRGGLDTDAMRRAWPDVLAKVFGIRRVTWTFLSEHAQVLDYDSERLLIGIATRGLAQTFRNGQHGEVVRQALIDARGIDTRVEGVALDDAAEAKTGGGARATGSSPAAGSRPDAGRGGQARAGHAGAGQGGAGQAAVGRGAGDRNADGRGPGDRGPADRGPADRGPADRGPADRGPVGRGSGDVIGAGRSSGPSADRGPSRAERTPPAPGDEAGADDDPAAHPVSRPPASGAPTRAPQSSATTVTATARSTGPPAQEGDTDPAMAGLQAGANVSGRPHRSVGGSAKEGPPSWAADATPVARGDADASVPVGGSGRPAEGARGDADTFVPVGGSGRSAGSDGRDGGGSAASALGATSTGWIRDDGPPLAEPPFDDEPPFDAEPPPPDDGGWAEPPPSRTAATPGSRPAVSRPAPEPSADRPGSVHASDPEPTADRARPTMGPQAQLRPATPRPADKHGPQEARSRQEPHPRQEARPRQEPHPPPGSSRRGIEAFRAARRAQRDRAVVASAVPVPAGVADDDVARDDEDITDLGAVGQPVIAAVLGGTVIAETDD